MTIQACGLLRHPQQGDKLSEHLFFEQVPHFDYLLAKGRVVSHTSMSIGLAADSSQ